ncbi:acyl-CoA thioesterase/BAAT N-terminal domain-containing protein [Pseudoxanthomonas sp. NC8]|nr:acyl-CoA thioesterase/BAAT N-terminal domain-containing protein [Pseudoxanthomonas sp. NC8]
MLLLAIAWQPALAGAQVLRTEPRESVLEGEPLRILTEGLQPGEQVSLSAERWYRGTANGTRPPQRLRSQVSVRADADGTIDLDRTPALAGSYAGIDPRGLFWSMSPHAGVAAPAGPVDTTRVELELERSAGVPLRASVALLSASPEVERMPVDALPGAVFARPRGSARPAGGDPAGRLRRRRFHRRGRRALRVAWLRRPGPALLLAAGCQWTPRIARIAGRHGRDAGRVTGPCPCLAGLASGRGCEPGRHPRHIDRWHLRPARCRAPGLGRRGGGQRSVRCRGRRLGPGRGGRQPFGIFAARAAVGVRPADRLRGRNRGRRARPGCPRAAGVRARPRRAPGPAARARIPVERIRGAVMLIGSYDDQLWPSGMMVQNLAERRHEAGLPVTTLIFTDAGHLLYESGYAPTTLRNRGRRKVGGSPEADARAQAQAWSQTFRFLEAALDEPSQPIGRHAPSQK